MSYDELMKEYILRIRKASDIKERSRLMVKYQEEANEMLASQTLQRHPEA